MPARRSIKKRDWPRGLYEPRPGYFTWRHPGTGETLAIGRVPLAVARNEALAANRLVAEQRPNLVERLMGHDKTVNDLLADMPVHEKANTAKSARSLDRKIAAALGTRACGTLTVRDVAEMVQAEIDAGRARQAQALRSRMVAVCRRGVAKGWMRSNPAEVTEAASVKTRRGRLTLETFMATYEQAPAVAPWLQRAMRWALVTGADRSTVAAMTRDMVHGDRLVFRRGKTDIHIAVPLVLRMECVGWSLAELVAEDTGVPSAHFLHHVKAYGNAPAGSPVFQDRISKAFTAARKLAGLPDDGAPTFHEIRSLCKRLYDAQGNVDTKALLGHQTDRMAAVYADPRGVEPVAIRVLDSPAK